MVGVGEAMGVAGRGVKVGGGVGVGVTVYAAGVAVVGDSTTAAVGGRTCPHPATSQHPANKQIIFLTKCSWSQNLSLDRIIPRLPAGREKMKLPKNSKRLYSLVVWR
jgi:hypothetical protein